MKNLFTIMAAVIAATVLGGYGDLPNTFNASTGYVTMDTADTLGDQQHSAFWDGLNWSDGEAPHATTNYYANKMFTTLMSNSVINAKLALDPTALTFKGRILVADQGSKLYLYSANFEIPDLRMLPGSEIYWGSDNPVVYGTMTAYGTATKPAKLIYGLSGENHRQPFGMDVVGDASSWISVTAPVAHKSVSGAAYHGFITLTGDLSEYYGTFKIDNTMNSGAWYHASIFGIELVSSAPNATFALAASNGCVCATAPGGVVVRSLSINDTDTMIALANVNSQAYDVPRFTVREPIAFNGRSVSLALYTITTKPSGPSTTYTLTPYVPDIAETIALVRLEPAAVNSLPGDPGDSFVFETTKTESLETWAMSKWLPDQDGGLTLRRLPYVRCLRVDGESHSSMANALDTTGTYNFWSDGLSPADPANAHTRYFSYMTMHVPPAPASTPFAFGGESLTICTNNFNLYRGGYGFRCPEIVSMGATFGLCNANVTSDGRKDDVDGRLYRVYRMQGDKLVLQAPYITTFKTWGVCQILRVETEVMGGGGMYCSTQFAKDNTLARGYHEFTAFNTNFTGKITVSAPYTTKSIANTPYTQVVDGVVYPLTVPNWTQRTRLFVYDERNLGGRRDTFAYDALYLEHYSDLFPLNDVTFTDGWNRGIAIGDIGRMHVTNGLTLTILRPLNVDGHLVKEGAGTLALGGTLTFGGAAQSATPTGGQNLFTVMGGSVKPLAAHAFDGLAITFTNNASIKLDATTSDADLLNFGIVDVKEQTAPIALAAKQASIPVTVNPPDGIPSRFTVAICTIGATPAASLDVTAFSVANTAHHRCRRVEKRTNLDGTVTYLAIFVSKGFAIDFR